MHTGVDIPASVKSRRSALVRVTVATWIAVCLFASAQAAPSGPHAVPEEEARAAFLFQLAQYVNWPAGAFLGDNTPMRFCVYSQDSLAVSLSRAVSGKTIQGRPLTVDQIADLHQAGGCHVIFLGITKERALKDTLDHWSYPPVLLVGEAEHFAEWGGIVNLVLQSGRISFEVNLAAAEHAHIQLRSQLLRFAHIVVDERGKMR